MRIARRGIRFLLRLIPLIVIISGNEYNDDCQERKKGLKGPRTAAHVPWVWTHLLGKGFTMKRKEIAAFLVGCLPDDLMAYRDCGEEGCVAIGPDGKKYVYDAAYLEQAEPKAEAALYPPKPKAKRTTKRQTTTKKKPRTDPKVRR